MCTRRWFSQSRCTRHGQTNRSTSKQHDSVEFSMIAAAGGAVKPCCGSVLPRRPAFKVLFVPFTFQLILYYNTYMAKLYRTE